MTIDGKNILPTYGCTILEGTYDSLLKYPTRKQVPFNNWAERDGIQPDLSVIAFEPRNIKMNFLHRAVSLSQFWEQYNKIIEDMSSPGYRTIIPDYGVSYPLRLNATSLYEVPLPFNQGKNTTAFSLDFIEDKYTQINAIPTVGIPLRGLFAINGYDFGEFGCGSSEQIGDILQYPDVKPPFTDGKNVSLKTVKLQHKEIKLSLWMLADTEQEFLANHAAFFSQFNKTGKQSLYISELGGTTEVYYTDCSNFKVRLWGQRIAVQFTISLVIPVVTWVSGGGTTIMRVLKDSGTQMLLADHTGKVIIFNK